MASSRGSTASSKPPKQKLAVTAQSATSKPWFTCSQPNSISCFQTEIVATHAKQRRTRKRHIPVQEVGAAKNLNALFFRQRFIVFAHLVADPNELDLLFVLGDPFEGCNLELTHNWTFPS